jgi:hypothetical protein
VDNIPPDKIAKLVYKQFDYFNPPVSLRDTILTAASQLNPQLSDLEIIEHIEEDVQEDYIDQDFSVLQKYIAALLRKEKEQRDKGLFCPYEVFADNDQIVGFSYPRSTDSPLMRRIRAVAPEVSEALEAIRSLQAGEFELFCSRILDLLKAEETQKTQDSRDDGIDFLGWLCIPETFTTLKSISLPHREFRMLVLGQAKRYKPENPVGVSHIRELVGTIASFHHDQLAPWPSKLQLNSFTLMSPILPLIMTTGRISRDAKDLAKKCGVITRDGAEIALFLCLENVGMEELEEQGISKLKFNKHKFMEWLYEPKA